MAEAKGSCPLTGGPGRGGATIIRQAMAGFQGSAAGEAAAVVVRTPESA
ncbi:MAG: hypothetical protein V3S82_09705 [Dehalococcoidia bacterium]